MVTWERFIRDRGGCSCEAYRYTVSRLTLPYPAPVLERMGDDWLAASTQAEGKESGVNLGSYYV